MTAEEISKMTDAEFRAAYALCVRTYQFHDNTDDIHSWREEREAREANKALLKSLDAEKAKRGIA